jgi:hypothetical protein
MSDQNDPSFVAIRDFVIAEAAYTQAKEKYSACRKTLLNLVPKEIGEHKVEAEGFTLTVKFPEKTKWDAEQLDALYGSDKPAYVKLSYSIDLRDLRRLPLSEQEQLKQCYEVVAGTPDIDIVKE